MPINLKRSCHSFSKNTDKSSLVGVTIGNFDGIHRGHQALISALLSELGSQAKHSSKTPYPVMLSFRPHPKVFFQDMDWLQARKAQDLLPVSNLREKLCLAEHYGIQYLVLEKFNAAVMNLSAEDFVDYYLVNCLNAKTVVVGEDFRFGKDRKGDTTELRNLSKKHGFKLLVLESVKDRKKKVSTSRLKALLLAAKMDEVAQLLGRPYELMEKVVRGDGRGQSLTGFRTLNTKALGRFRPASGVYFSQVYLNSNWLDSVSNVGSRPTVDGKNFFIETHVLNQDFGDLYGQRIRLRFLKHLRSEKVFSGVPELKQAIKQDIESAKKWFSVQSRDD